MCARNRVCLPTLQSHAERVKALAYSELVVRELEVLQILEQSELGRHVDQTIVAELQPSQSAPALASVQHGNPRQPTTEGEGEGEGCGRAEWEGGGGTKSCSRWCEARRRGRCSTAAGPPGAAARGGTKRSSRSDSECERGSAERAGWRGWRGQTKVEWRAPWCQCVSLPRRSPSPHSRGRRAV